MLGKLFQRLMNVFKSNANDAIDKMEDPVKMIKLAISEMELAIQKSTDALAKAMGHQKTLEKKMLGFKTESEDWMKKATLAIKSGDDGLGKKALEKKSLADKQLEQYELMNKQSLQTIDQLKSQLERLKVKFDEAKAKESILIARSNSSKAQSEIADQLSGISLNGLGNFNRFEEKINAMAAEAEAKVELIEATSKVDKEFELLETDAKIYEDFEAIKLKIQEDEAAKLLAEEIKKQKLLEQKFANSKLESKDLKTQNIEKAIGGSKDVQKIFEELNNIKPDSNDPSDKFKDFFNKNK